MFTKSVELILRQPCVHTTTIYNYTDRHFWPHFRVLGTLNGHIHRITKIFLRSLKIFFFTKYRWEDIKQNLKYKYRFISDYNYCLSLILKLKFWSAFFFWCSSASTVKTELVSKSYTFQNIMNVICNYVRLMQSTHYFQRWIMFTTLIDPLETDPCDGWNMSSTFLYAAILRSQTKPRIQPYQAGNSASSPDQYSAQIHTCFIHNDNARDIHSWTFGKLWFNGQCKTRFSRRLLRAFFRTKLLKI